MTGTPILLVVSLLAAAPQQATTPRFDDARFVPPLLEQHAPSTALMVSATTRLDPFRGAVRPTVEASGPARQASAGEARKGLTWSALAHRLGGALVGGWIGYVGAQVVKSDWDKETNSSFRNQRSTWAVAGAVLGVVSSHLFGNTRSPAAGGGVPMRPSPRDRSYLGEAEIRESDAQSAYDLIYNTRMHWLVTRGANSVAESARGEASGDFQIRVTPGRDRIIVYMDDIRLGGVEEMRDIPTDLLTSARFFDARQATLRYGGGHAHGAILLSTEVEH